jgi:hypothetical protein
LKNDQSRLDFAGMVRSKWSDLLVSIETNIVAQNCDQTMLRRSYSGALPLFPALLAFKIRPKGNAQQIAGAYEGSAGGSSAG